MSYPASGVCCIGETNNIWGPPAPKKLWEMFHEWKDKIIKLLNHHHAQLVDEEKHLWVVMQASSDGKVHVHEFAMVPWSVPHFRGG